MPRVAAVGARARLLETGVSSPKVARGSYNKNARTRLDATLPCDIASQHRASKFSPGSAPNPDVGHQAAAPMQTTKRNYAVVLNVYDLNAANDWTHGVGVGSYRVLHSTKI